MKVLVTGGSGFIGTHTVNRLLDRGHSPLVLDPHPTKTRSFQPDDSVETFLGDIRDSTAVTEAMAHSDSWIHLGGVLGTAETIFNPRPAAETNILGGLNVLEAASQYGLPGVNIAVGNFWMNNTYSITKNSVERFACMFRDERGLAVTNVRALNAYGPGQSVAHPYGNSKVRKIMPSFVCRALSGTDIEVYGDGDQVMDMVYVKDVADILVSALEYTAEFGSCEKVLEAGSGDPTTVNDIANAVVNEVAGRPGRGRVEISNLPMRPGEPQHSVVLGDPRTLSEIGYDYSGLTGLESGLVPTVDYFQEYLSGLK
jgi:UDP-glucose 4-epimerase